MESHAPSCAVEDVLMYVLILAWVILCGFLLLPPLCGMIICVYDMSLRLVFVPCCACVLRCLACVVVRPLCFHFTCVCSRAHTNMLPELLFEGNNICVLSCSR